MEDVNTYIMNKPSGRSFGAWSVGSQFLAFLPVAWRALGRHSVSGTLVNNITQALSDGGGEGIVYVGASNQILNM